MSRTSPHTHAHRGITAPIPTQHAYTHAPPKHPPHTPTHHILGELLAHAQAELVARRGIRLELGGDGVLLALDVCRCARASRASRGRWR